jgi:hypothetical protein
VGKYSKDNTKITNNIFLREHKETFSIKIAKSFTNKHRVRLGKKLKGQRKERRRRMR